MKPIPLFTSQHLMVIFFPNMFGLSLTIQQSQGNMENPPVVISAHILFLNILIIL